MIGTVITSPKNFRKVARDGAGAARYRAWLEEVLWIVVIYIAVAFVVAVAGAITGGMLGSMWIGMVLGITVGYFGCVFGGYISEDALSSSIADKAGR